MRSRGYSGTVKYDSLNYAHEGRETAQVEGRDQIISSSNSLCCFMIPSSIRSVYPFGPVVHSLVSWDGSPRS
jgi:hypothetical protein